ncbi:RQC domain-containing protein [Neobacillus kokaensis]|uniref:RQC domain-containing protein n=1 Tax=Neobacillus kokaensis TaxID=2759023 RepID=A0ABQ3N1X6_9BACI|nr:RQC domain-containing protein [Neobacillus kokaensis]GHH98945.1 hypothetical protein AM1BK_24880 [Neobacillus kokaensis]
MSKKVEKAGLELDSMGIEQLSDIEIITILEGAADLEMYGGRTMLVKILTGSKDKKLLEDGWDQCPVYGAFKGTSQKEVLAMVDWMIINDFLSINKGFGIPLLEITDKGMEILHETFAEKQEEDSNKKTNHETISFSAYKQWMSIPEEFRRQLERNVWCSNCVDVVQIQNYTVDESKHGIVLHGTCKKCGHEVARVID